MSYNCYIIFNGNFSYVGITNNLKRRIRQHNQEIKGGAKYTRMIGPGWNFACYISGFKTKNDALKFEWALKHVKPKKLGGIENRVDKLFKLIYKKYWTKNSPCSINYKLTINWCEIFLIPEDLIGPEYITHDFVTI